MQGSSVSPVQALRRYKPSSVDFVGFLVVYFTLLTPFSPSFTGFPKLCLSFGCGSLHLLPVVGWSLSDDKIMLDSCLQA